MNLERYRGHLTLPEVGVEGQRRLASASVLCVGTGGLGSPALLYLAAAGVGRIGLVDADEVDTSNLHRQVLFRTGDVGLSKVDVAHDTLAALNPDVTLVKHPVRLNASNAAEILAGYDVIVDGTDNFPTRYLINDTCVRLGKPEVWASIYRFEGQVASFDARQGPCYRCLFREIPPDEEIPSCAEAGVLGVLPGILGTVQALEAIKLVLGIGKSLVGRLMVFDALSLTWQELEVDKDPDCPACGANAGRTPVQAAVSGIEPRELQQRLAGATPPWVLDCRDPSEWEICHLANSHLIPLGELSGRVQEVPTDRPVVVVCYRGPRSERAATILARAGYPDVSYLDGGLDAWARQIDPAMPRY